MRWAPECWFYDWSQRSPMDVKAVRSQMVAALAGVRLPAGWLTGGFKPRPSVVDELWNFDDLDATLDSLLDDLVSDGRAVRTLEKHRNPFLKMVFFLAVRGKPVQPPEPVDVGRYLALLLRLRFNEGALTSAKGALHYVCALNGWPLVASTSVAQIPLDAAARLCGRPVSKSRPLEPWMVAAMWTVLVPGGMVAATPDCAFALAVLVGFLCTGRFACLCRARYDDGYCTVTPDEITFFFDVRKNDPGWKGHSVVIARSGATELGGTDAYSVLVLAKRVFGVGPVLRRVDKRGREPARLAPPFLDEPKFDSHGNRSLRNMLYGPFVQMLRAVLVRIGLSSAEADEYAAHSMRRGSVTALKKRKCDGEEIMDRAGVTSDGWVAGYDEVSPERKRALSLQFGL